MEQNETLSGDVRRALALENRAFVMAAAEQMGMERTTHYRGLAQPEFRLRAAQLRPTLTRRALSRMNDGMADAAGQINVGDRQINVCGG